MFCLVTHAYFSGNALVNNLELPFHSLKFAFGESFLQRFRGSFVSSATSEADILDHVILVDTPGTLDGSGEDRNYNFSEVMGWFAKRAALIIIFFDVNKMGVSTEMKSVLDNIQGNEEKIKIVFNKADTVGETDLAGSLAGNIIMVTALPVKVSCFSCMTFSSCCLLGLCCKKLSMKNIKGQPSFKKMFKFCQIFM